MRGKHNLIEVFAFIAIAFSFFVLLDPMTSPTGKTTNLAVGEGHLGIKGTYNEGFSLDFSLDHVPNKILFNGKGSGKGFIWVEKEGREYFLATFDNENLFDYCLNTCKLDWTDGSFTLHVQIDEGRLKINDIYYEFYE